ncbi:MAG: hypothetical protein H8E37_12525 [Planctomycetes bacterium]|nr:hypothetical protein [Planctomycetota bacterium]
MASSLFLVNLETVTSFAATYWLHSTLLLGAAWLLLCSAKPDSHFVRERIWKLAATAGFATAAVQLATGLGISLVTEPDSTPSEQASRLVTRSVSEGLSRETSPSNLTPAEASRHLKTSLQIVQESLNELGEGLPATLAESKSQDEPAPRKSTVAPKIDPALLTSVTYLPLEEGVTLNPIPVETTESADVLEETVVPSTVPDAESTSADNRWFPGAVSAVVLAWFSLSLLYLAWQSLRFRWQMRHVSPAAPSHRKLLDSICGSRGVKRRVRLLNSDRFEEPVKTILNTEKKFISSPANFAKKQLNSYAGYREIPMLPYSPVRVIL